LPCGGVPIAAETPRSFSGGEIRLAAETGARPLFAGGKVESQSETVSNISTLHRR